MLSCCRRVMAICRVPDTLYQLGWLSLISLLCFTLDVEEIAASIKYEILTLHSFLIVLTSRSLSNSTQIYGDLFSNQCDTKEVERENPNFFFSFEE